jgi:hypothetical protein
MPAERVSMRRVREILPLKFECGASDRAIPVAVAVAVAVARSTGTDARDKNRGASAPVGMPQGGRWRARLPANAQAASRVVR